MTNDDARPFEDWYRAAVNRYEGPLVRYASKLLGDVERARDVVQDTFVQLCCHRPEQLDGYLAQWLFTVCRNRAMDVCKKESRMKKLSSAASAVCVDHRADHVEALTARDTAEQVKVILDELPENQQEVVRLKFQNGLSYREISEVTQLSVSNVGYLIHTALKSVRDRMTI